MGLMALCRWLLQFEPRKRAWDKTRLSEMIVGTDRAEFSAKAKSMTKGGSLFECQ